jgi:quercetin dioxygenase-like cupin family protein
MEEIFPPPVRALPEADVPIAGVAAYLSQAEGHQIVFMQFSQEVRVGEHSHEAQWGIVLEGEIELTVGGMKNTYSRGDRYFIPKGVPHCARIFAGYADVTFFNQPSRYQAKERRTP